MDSEIVESASPGRAVENVVVSVIGKFGHQSHQFKAWQDCGIELLGVLAVAHSVYTDESIASIQSHFAAAVTGLQELQLHCVKLAHDARNDKVREYLSHGIGRRLHVLRNALTNIFTFFPVATTRPLAEDDLTDAQVNLHAFVINLSGVLDNFAWVYVLRHDLEARIGDRRRIGLFSDKTSRYFPASVKQHLASSGIATWYGQYVKGYRDALAHRIALYIPSAVWTPAESERYKELNSEIWDFLRSSNIERAEELRREQDSLGKPCFFFLHSNAADEAPKPLQLHPQVLADAETVLEFGRVFFRHWEEPPA